MTRSRRSGIFVLAAVILLLIGCGRAEVPPAQVSQAFVAPTAAPVDTPEPTVTPEPTPEPTPEVTATPELTPEPAPMAPGDIPMEAVDSSCFSRVGYDRDTETLVVVFLDSGSKYAYYDVPRDVYDALMNADSIGGYYNRAIKGAYACEQIG